MKYPDLDDSIRKTYVRHSKSSNSNSSYDSYFKAFRWASNRIKDQGVICFVTNGSWIDSNSADGFRKSLEDEFSSVFVFNLRGNQRTQGKLSHMEGGKIFGEGSRTPVAITLLVRNPKHKGPVDIYYYDIGDYLTREEKLKIISKFGEVEEIPWTQLLPNASGDWINQRDEKYSTFIPLSDKDNKGRDSQAIFKMFSTGIQTGRDMWSYNFSKQFLVQNTKKMVTNYNNFLSDFKKARKSISEITRASKKDMSWSAGLLDKLKRGKQAVFNEEDITSGIYRPFQKMWLYRENFFVERRYQTHVLFPKHLDNLVIHTTGPGASVAFSALVTNTIPNKLFMDNGQCYPMYYYPESPLSEPENSLFASDDSSSQLHAVSDWALNTFRSRYSNTLTKEDIFYYVCGVLSAPEYQRKFTNELKKDIPRVPFLEDFVTYKEFGKKLAELHLNYENFKNDFCEVTISNTKVKEKELYKVEKMRFGKNNDKSILIFNENITIRNIPEETFQYIVNGKTPIEWIIDRYLVQEDSESAIVNDPNEYSDDPKYVFNLLLSVIAMTKEVLKLHKSLPELVIPEA